MGRRHLSPENFGTHATAWPDAMFEIRVSHEDDLERLRAAVRHESERPEPREWRIAAINQRLAELDA